VKTLLVLLSLLLGCNVPVTTTTNPDWLPFLDVQPVDVEGSSEPSSSKLHVLFDEYPEACAHRIWARNERGLELGMSAPSGDLIFEGLPSGTDWRVGVEAIRCDDAFSTRPLASIEARTAEEVWRFVGERSDYSGLHRIVDDGNAKFHAFRYGDDAPPELAGRLQLYYGAAGPDLSGLSVGLSGGPATADPDSFTRFTSLAGTSGLLRPEAPSGHVDAVNTGQAVPLSKAMGGAVRLMFEARGEDGATRILHIDSVDGVIGRDFHAGDKTVCDTAFDYTEPCAPTVDVGVASDEGGAPVPDVRQFRVALPTRDEWQWSGAEGTWMLATVDADGGCDRDGFANQALLQWKEGAWHMGHFDGCPPTIEDLQAPSPVHMGGDLWKVYGGRPSQDGGRIETSPLPYPGPKVVLYVDRAVAGDPEVLEFADFDPIDEARAVHFEWPSGEPMTDRQEGYLDDFVVIEPTDDPDVQVWLGAVTDGEMMPFGAAAILVNP
jgi:hypothetical protein